MRGSSMLSLNAVLAMWTWIGPHVRTEGARRHQKATRTPMFFFLELFQPWLLNCLNHVMRQIYALLFVDLDLGFQIRL